VKHIFLLRSLVPQGRSYTQSRNGRSLPGVQIKARSSNLVSRETHHEVETNETRNFCFMTVFLLALESGSRRPAAPQSKGSSTLTGIVLGPDDKPVAVPAENLVGEEGKGSVTSSTA